MNKQRRRALAALMGQLTELKDQLEIILEEEESASDNIPDQFYNCEKEEKKSAIIEAVGYLDSAHDCLLEAVLQ